MLDFQNEVTNCDLIEPYCAMFTKKSQPFSKKNLKTADFFLVTVISIAVSFMQVPYKSERL